MLLKTFGWSFAITAAGLALAGVLWGWQGLAIVAILSVLEVSVSFDNAVINAGILRKMNPFWQKMFLTLGILIAVFGMRLVFPVVIVAVTAQLGPIEAVKVAIQDHDRYEALVTSAHPAIAAFGGMFLLMIFLDFIFEDRDIKWLGWLERPLAKIGKLETLSIVVSLVVLLIAATTFATAVPVHDGEGTIDKATTVLLAGIGGLVTYLVVGGISDFFESRLEEDEEDDEESEGEAAKDTAPAAKQGNGSVVGLAGKAAFFMFLYLEVIDASFSFDGVIGAFAITNDIFVMAIGLGIGAMYIRSLTVFLVRKGTLDDYVYLEHGAHYAIGALAVILMISIKHEIPEVITGLIGVALIGLSFLSSVMRNRKAAAEGSDSGAKSEVASGV
ncbi:DUF475 domain-containing protein [Streptomyces telluris]|uniref:DUF475 domain-containing protein n=1 Tax=Streptomyces telluris TaxID=2720021 RepID=A0A9X2RKQ0_9ACTN|nr:DUF475 domain-containing protein [Streptomyces telluris]MCQ8770052.1 DUF475 domain-containing protein [Streptomyces telluris]NJP76474.1 DUF475 domain-containing protein [Streptomyces telluris]